MSKVVSYMDTIHIYDLFIIHVRLSTVQAVRVWGSACLAALHPAPHPGPNPGPNPAPNPGVWENLAAPARNNRYFQRAVSNGKGSRLYLTIPKVSILLYLDHLIHNSRV